MHSEQLHRFFEEFAMSGFSKTTKIAAARYRKKSSNRRKQMRKRNKFGCRTEITEVRQLLSATSASETVPSECDSITETIVFHDSFSTGVNGDYLASRNVSVSSGLAHMAATDSRLQTHQSFAGTRDDPVTVELVTQFDTNQPYDQAVIRGRSPGMDSSDGLVVLADSRGFVDIWAKQGGQYTGTSRINYSFQSGQDYIVTVVDASPMATATVKNVNDFSDKVSVTLDDISFLSEGSIAFEGSRNHTIDQVTVTQGTQSSGTPLFHDETVHSVRMDDVIPIETDATLTLQTFTVLATVDRNTTSTPHTDIAASIGIETTGSVGRSGFFFGFWNNKAYAWAATSALGVPFELVSTETFTDTNRPYELAVTVDDTADTVTMYVDGDIVAQSQLTVPIRYASDRSFIGNDYTAALGGPSFQANAEIGPFTMYAHVLTQEEVRNGVPDDSGNDQPSSMSDDLLLQNMMFEGGSLVKKTENGWDAFAITTSAADVGEDFTVSARIGAADMHLQFGVTGNSSNDAVPGTLHVAFEVHENHNLYVLVDGTRHTVGTWADDDVLSMTRIATEIVLQQNGSVIFGSPVPSITPLHMRVVPWSKAAALDEVFVTWVGDGTKNGDDGNNDGGNGNGTTSITPLFREESVHSVRGYDSVSVETDETLTLQSFTLLGTLKRNRTSRPHTDIVASIGIETSSTIGRSGVFLAVWNNKPYFWAATSAAGAPFELVGAKEYTDLSQPIEIAVTVDDATNTVTLYANGEVAARGQLNAPIRYDTDTSVMGNDHNAELGQASFVADTDVVSVTMYSEVLSHEQIRNGVEVAAISDDDDSSNIKNLDDYTVDAAAIDKMISDVEDHGANAREQIDASMPSSFNLNNYALRNDEIPVGADAWTLEGDVRFGRMYDLSRILFNAPDGSPIVSFVTSNTYAHSGFYNYLTDENLRRSITYQGRFAITWDGDVLELTTDRYTQRIDLDDATVFASFDTTGKYAASFRGMTFSAEGETYGERLDEEWWQVDESHRPFVNETLAAVPQMNSEAVSRALTDTNWRSQSTAKLMALTDRDPVIANNFASISPTRLADQKAELAVVKAELDDRSLTLVENGLVDVEPFSILFEKSARERTAAIDIVEDALENVETHGANAREQIDASMPSSFNLNNYALRNDEIPVGADAWTLEGDVRFGRMYDLSRILFNAPDGSPIVSFVTSNTYAHSGFYNYLTDENLRRSITYQGRFAITWDGDVLELTTDRYTQRIDLDDATVFASFDTTGKYAASFRGMTFSAEGETYGERLDEALDGVRDVYRSLVKPTVEAIQQLDQGNATTKLAAVENRLLAVERLVNLKLAEIELNDELERLSRDEASLSVAISNRDDLISSNGADPFEFRSAEADVREAERDVSIANNELNQRRADSERLAEKAIDGAGETIQSIPLSRLIEERDYWRGVSSAIARRLTDTTSSDQKIAFGDSAASARSAIGQVYWLLGTRSSSDASLPPDDQLIEIVGQSGQLNSAIAALADAELSLLGTNTESDAGRETEIERHLLEIDFLRHRLLTRVEEWQERHAVVVMLSSTQLSEIVDVDVEVEHATVQDVAGIPSATLYVPELGGFALISAWTGRTVSDPTVELNSDGVSARGQMVSFDLAGIDSLVTEIGLSLTGDISSIQFLRGADVIHSATQTSNGTYSLHDSRGITGVIIQQDATATSSVTVSAVNLTADVNTPQVFTTPLTRQGNRQISLATVYDWGNPNFDLRVVAYENEVILPQKLAFGSGFAYSPNHAPHLYQRLQLLNVSNNQGIIRSVRYLNASGLHSLPSEYHTFVNSRMVVIHPGAPEHLVFELQGGVNRIELAAAGRTFADAAPFDGIRLQGGVINVRMQPGSVEGFIDPIHEIHDSKRTVFFGDSRVRVFAQWRNEGQHGGQVTFRTYGGFESDPLFHFNDEFTTTVSSLGTVTLMANVYIPNGLPGSGLASVAITQVLDDGTEIVVGGWRSKKTRLVRTTREADDGEQRRLISLERRAGVQTRTYIVSGSSGGNENVIETEIPPEALRINLVSVAQHHGEDSDQYRKVVLRYPMTYLVLNHIQRDDNQTLFQQVAGIVGLPSDVTESNDIANPKSTEALLDDLESSLHAAANELLSGGYTDTRLQARLQALSPGARLSETVRNFVRQGSITNVEYVAFAHDDKGHSTQITTIGDVAVVDVYTNDALSTFLSSIFFWRHEAAELGIATPDNLSFGSTIADHLDSLDASVFVLSTAAERRRLANEQILELTEFPVDGTGWQVVLGSPFHNELSALPVDHTFAMDFNLPKHHDKGMPVRAAFDGVVQHVDPKLGYVVIRHSLDGLVWYTEYMHMELLEWLHEGTPRVVESGDILGTISSVGVPKRFGNNEDERSHLHFVISISAIDEIRRSINTHSWMADHNVTVQVERRVNGQWETYNAHWDAVRNRWHVRAVGWYWNPLTGRWDP